MYRFIIFTLISFYFFCMPQINILWAKEAPSLNLKSNDKKINLSKYLSWFNDPDHRLTIEDIINPEKAFPFEDAKGKSLNFGFSSDTYWLKLHFTTENFNSPALRYIHIKYPLLNYINCFIFHNKKMQKIKCGTKYPFSNRPIKHPEFIFPIQILPGKNITVYFQVKSSSSIQFPMVLWEPSEFFSNEIVLFMGSAGLYSFFIVISLLNLIFFWMFRYRTFLIYAFFIIAYVLFHISYKGFGIAWIWPNWNNWGMLSVPFFIFLTSASVLLFTSHFFDIQKQIPRINNIFQSLIYFSLFSTVLPFILPYALTIKMSLLIIIITSILIMFTTILCVKLNIPHANFFLIAWLMVISGTATYVLKTIGLLPSIFLIEKSVEIGYCLCIIMLGYSLFNQFQKERMNNKRIKEQAIKEREESAQIQQMTISVLDQKTEQLHEISSNLTLQIDQLNLESDTVAGASEEMSANVETIASSVEELSTNIQGVSSSTAQMLENNSTVASAIQELTASMNQISSHAQSGTNISSEVVLMAENAGQTIKNLGVAANQIGTVTEVIKKIAEKTDILAVNAAIEAASAGEAGKGFAVVANEITKFSEQSAGAAEDITKQIGDVQNQTLKAIEGIANMEAVIKSMSHSSESISEAVEQQTQALHEISDNASHANIKADEIAHIMSEMSLVSCDISKNVMEASKGVNEIARSIRNLNLSGQTLSSISQQIEQESQDMVALKKKSAVSGLKK